MISVREVFLKNEINSIDEITDPERMNLNAYLLDHYSLGFKDIHSEAFNNALQNAVMHSAKSIDIPIQIVKTVNRNKASFRDDVIFQEV